MMTIIFLAAVGLGVWWLVHKYGWAKIVDFIKKQIKG